MTRNERPYGTWPSDVSLDALVEGATWRRWPCADGDDLYWVESDPARAGRAFVRRHRRGQGAPVWVADLAVRSRVHSYGARPIDVRDGRVVVVGDDDQRLYLLAPGRDPEALSAPTPGRAVRHGAPGLDGRGRVVALRERDTPAGTLDEVVLVELASRAASTVLAGHDFFGAPALSPDGARVAVVAWDDPDMAWDSSVLIEVDLAEGTHRVVLGGAGESVTQPRYGPDGALYAVSDRTGWWNLHRRDGEDWVNVTARAAEFAPPPWLAGETSYAVRADRSVLVTWTRDGLDHVGLVSPSGELAPLEGPWTCVEGVAAAEGAAGVVAGGPLFSDRVERLDLAGGRAGEVVASTPLGMDPADVARPETLLVEAPAGPVHALYYPPTSARWRGPRDEAPPAVLHAHSGPTRRAPARFALDVQFWTTRGYAYLDVNYAGSTGYGRAYRERLRGRWGEGDVEDCAACVAACARRGLLDPARVVSIGASASGVTTLGLARRGVLAAASLRYPVTDLGGLAAAPARVEAHYLEGLVGPRPGADDLYRERSALGFADELTTPLVLFHGTEDEVVPLGQSLALAAALEARGVPHCLVVVEGEGHGFRDPTTWRREAAIEESFFARVLGLGPFDETLGVEIRHAGALAPLAP